MTVLIERRRSCPDRALQKRIQSFLKNNNPNIYYLKYTNSIYPKSHVPMTVATIDLILEYVWNHHKSPDAGGTFFTSFLYQN